MAKCRFCSKEITWMKEGKKNVPVETDGTVHDCEIFAKSRASTKNITPGSLSPEEIARYEGAINDEAQKKKKR
ncbi:MAG: hypothetical protein CME71_01665 [Halobacteriovorax sp.]|nr:hypothetical protein [Halobacteriovorax sp.]|tara:strand:+ start:28252 stop:28470 length:219 start_codon:yes stop_codon:yes gene_type:complete